MASESSNWREANRAQEFAALPAFERAKIIDGHDRAIADLQKLVRQLSEIPAGCTSDEVIAIAQRLDDALAARLDNPIDRMAFWQRLQWFLTGKVEYAGKV